MSDTRWMVEDAHGTANAQGLTREAAIARAQHLANATGRIWYVTHPEAATVECVEEDYYRTHPWARPRKPMPMGQALQTEEAAAAEEQSLDYFNRYVAGDR